MNVTTMLTRRLLADDADGPGPLPRIGPEALVALLREAGLTGRGGAGFPVWRKLAAVAETGRVPVVIGNGSEGEPASAKDRVLLTYRADLVLDGLQIVAGALGARTAHLSLPAALAPRLEARLRARRDPIAVTITVAPDRFVAGEASAVANAVAGRTVAGRSGAGGSGAGRAGVDQAGVDQAGVDQAGVDQAGAGRAGAGRVALPSDKAVRLSRSGVGGAPTLVQNVETLAHVALIARRGAAWFREAGTAEEPGTFLATVGGAVARPGVLEAGYGVTLAELIDGAGGATAPIQAVLMGGYHGAWIPALPDLPVSRAGLAGYAASPGAGVVHVLPADACGLAETARIAGYLAGQVAGQCGPCVNGLPRLADTLTQLTNGLPRAAEVARLAALVDGRGACHHPDGTVRLIRSSLALFAADVDAHLTGRCLANGAPR